MPYAVWICKTGKEGQYVVDGMPPLPANVAVPITTEQLLVAKYLHDVVIFETVQGMDDQVPEKIEFEGKTYHYIDGVFNPPVEQDVYDRMLKEGVI